MVKNLERSKYRLLDVYLLLTDAFMKPRFVKVAARPHQNGVGVVEVLVALVVVSLGVLGMASLQLTGMQQSTGAYNRAKALLYAETMATRMRTNRPAIDSFLFDGFNSDVVDCSVAPAPYCQAATTGAAQSCTAAELAAFDLANVACGDWGGGGADDGVVGSLPNGQMVVTCDGAPCTGASTYTINVSWTEGQRTTSDMTDTVTRRVQLRMLP